jgi:hypothetical protein
MKRTKDDPWLRGGGPAFPVPVDSGVLIAATLGMTIRDWFAGQALAGMMSTPIDTGTIAKDAYAVADAMLVVRDQKTT